MSSLAAEPETRAAEAPPERPRRRLRAPARVRAPRLPARAHGPLTGLAVALAVAGSAFGAQGGSKVERTTWTEVVLLLLGAAVTAVALLNARRSPMGARHPEGPLLAAAFGLLAIFTALSIVWSLAPATSWQEANRTFAYLAVLAGAVGLARLAPHRWAAVLGGLAGGTAIVCLWSLATKVFPAALAPDEPFARLRPPFEYWNSVGVMAAMGILVLLWLAVRRSGHAAVNALAWPGLGLLAVCLMLSYSRGALLALGVGLAAFLALVPLRLRAAAALAGAGIPAAAVVAWGFAQDGLTRDRAPMTARVDAGQELGALLVLLAVALLAAGLAAGFLASRHHAARRARRRIGAGLLAALALVPVVAVVALATAPGGLDGQVSKGWKQLTDPAARTPGNTPERLTATSSVRARYWDEAIKVHGASPWVGTGAGAYGTIRSRYRQNGDVLVQHAHGYVVQTLADLGWIGLGLSVLAVLAWLWGAARALGARRHGRGAWWDAERIGLATLFAVSLAFGLHSIIDWTWSVPGNAVPALIAAGWIAGRAPRFAAAPSALGAGPAPGGAVAAAPTRRPPWRRVPSARAAVAGLVLASALLAAWAALQPVRALHAQQAAYDRLDAGAPAAAASIAEIAHERNPLDPDPMLQLAAIQQGRGRLGDAQRALEEAIRIQPASVEAWRRLGRFALVVRHDPRTALKDFQAAYYLDPQNPRSWSDLIVTTRILKGGG